MKVSAVLVALACALHTGSAMTLEKRDYHTCQTSSASPRVADCKSATSALDPNKCYDTNASGSGCQSIRTYGSCRISICRDDGNRPGRVLGSDVKAGLRVLLDKCPNSGKVGGYYHYPSVPHRAKCPVPNGPYAGYVNVEFSST